MKLIIPVLISDQNLPSGTYKKETSILFENHLYQLVQGNTSIKFKERLLAGIIAISSLVMTLGFAIFWKATVNYCRDFFWGKRKVVYLAALPNLSPHLREATENRKTAFALTVLGHQCYFNPLSKSHSNESFKQALLYFNQALKIDPTCTSALMARAQVYQQNHHLDLALKDVDAVLTIDSKDTSALAIRETIYQEKNKEKFESKDSEPSNLPDSEDILSSPKGKDLAVDVEHLELTLPDLTTPISPKSKGVPLPSSSPKEDHLSKDADHLNSTPKNPNVTNTVDTPKFEDVSPSLNRENSGTLTLKGLNLAIFNNPTDQHALKARAEWYLKNIKLDPKNIELSIKDFTVLTALNSKDSDAFAKLGYLYQFKGDFSLALEHLTTAITLDPKNTLALETRGLVYLNQKRNLKKFDLALDDLNSALEIKPRTFSLLLKRAEVHKEKGNLDLALKDLDLALELNHPKPAPALKRRGEIYLKQKQIDKALNDLNATLTLDSKYASAFSLRGQLYLLKGKGNRENLELALADFSSAIKYDPKDYFALLHRGIIYGIREEFNLALQDFDSILTLKPEACNALFHRAITHERKGELGLALLDLKEALRIKPNDSTFQEKYTALRKKYNVRTV